MTSSRRLPWTACLFAACLLLAMSGVQALDEGKPAPDFEIATLDGKVFKSSEADGDVIVINLWATWCSFCREEMPALETYYQRHKSAGLRMIAVSMDDPAEQGKVREIMKSYGYAGGFGHLSKLKGFGRIWRLPMTFVIDRQGILRKDGSTGEPNIDLATLEEVVTPLLAASATPRRP
jgi:cytochrome c biogenesis protein CcmG, thiol:disulfide interchange protein DsbE